MNQNVIHVRYSSIIIPNYTLGDNEKLEQMLSVWNKSYYRFENIGFAYDEEKKELRVPRGLDVNYISNLFKMPVQFEREADPFVPASIRLKVEPRSDIQRKSISYLLGEGDFDYTKKHTQLTLNLDTGDGKTYCVIAALSFMKKKSLIVTHADGIKFQWRDSLLKMTDINEKYIFNIDGSATIKKILKLDKLPYKVYLVNHRTIQSFAKKNGWDKVTELFRKLEIGVKVYDEAHLEFENMMKTDLYTNTAKTIYLTANFERSHHRENKLFSLCFKNIAKYGVQTRNEKRKHINYLAVKYNSKPNIDVQASMKGIHGFNKNKYVDYQITKQIFFDVILYVTTYFKVQEGKILIMVTKTDAADAVGDYLKEVVEDKTIGVYHSKRSDEEKGKALMCDIIISTPKSLGTGSDIPGLRTVIMTEQYVSPIQANQASGRLREYAPDMFTFFVELIDIGFSYVTTMHKKRMPIFKKKCANILELKYTQ